MSGDILLFFTLFCIFLQKNLLMSKKSSTFAPLFGKWPILEGWVSG